MHIIIEVLKPQQETIAIKAVLSTNDGKLEFINMNIVTNAQYIYKEMAAPINENADKYIMPCLL